MDSVPARLRKLAQRVLASEAGEKTGERRTAFCVSEKLRMPLSDLTGVAGFRALLSRALALAGEEVRWMKAIHVNPRGSLEGLDDACARLSQDEIAEGEAVLIARLIGLLVTFIGTPLTLHLLQDVWPELSTRDLGSDTEDDYG